MKTLLAKIFVLLQFAGLSACAVETDTKLGSRLQPVPEHAKFIDEDYFIWGGSVVEDEQGRFHMFYSRWKRELGHNAWVTHSEIARAVADSPLGPYRHVDVPLKARGAEYWDGLCTHNPTVKKFNGKYYLYYMGNTGDGQAMRSLNWSHRNNQRIGVAVAGSPAGPWEIFDSPLIDVSEDESAPDSLMVSNPTVTSTHDGRYLLIYKAVTRKGAAPFGGPVVHLAATSDSPTGPFKKHDKVLFVREGVKFPAEDPFIWREGNRYRGIVKDMKGYFTGEGQSLALFESRDGLDWYPSDEPLVSRLEINWEGRGIQNVAHLERPQVLLKDGTPAVLYCAADETREHSFNVHIPISSE